MKEKSKGGNRAPRAKGGKFGTSEAAKRRAALHPVPAAPETANANGGNAVHLIKAVPEASGQAVIDAAKGITQATIDNRLAMVAFQKVQQRLAVVDANAIIVKSAPEAARYLVALVRGEHESAPHDVRLRAAGMILEYAGLGLAVSAEERDLSQLTINELEQRLNGMSLAGESSTIHSDESPNPPDAAPLPPSGARPILE